MKTVVAAKERPYYFFSAYAPQSGYSDPDSFGACLMRRQQRYCRKVSSLSQYAESLRGSRNVDGERILQYAESHNQTMVNTLFRKRDSLFISFYSGSTRTQIDFVLVKDRDRKLVTDAKVVLYETVAPQHRLLICTLKIAPKRLKQVERCGVPRISATVPGGRTEFLFCHLALWLRFLVVAACHACLST
ncbi:unnamed protein product [Heligmosomoides polygyrus]|uniref:Sema domain-containing protein n=1 Tax=Heligmosomoides polygyrus TaxID=6339 RepID=A0A183GS29_HELPZ|nr:unnamed protein product [Heligmosomoides polygyrus]